MTIVSNNPGNIRFTGVQWDGLDDPPQDARNFCRFVTMSDGVRALAKVLLAYQDKHNLHTIREMITRLAPPSENNTGGYFADVAHRMATGPDDPIDVHQADVMGGMVAAISWHETGQHIDAQVIADGVARALA